MNNQPVDRQSDETRLTGELDAMYGCYSGGTPDEDELKDWQEFKAKLLVWHETEKQKLLKQVWNLSQPDIVPDGWKPDTKLGKWLKDNINKSQEK